MTGHSGNFTLPSVAVSCSYDEPAPELTLPVDLEDRTSGISVLEGGFPLPTRLCRFVRPHGLVGLRLAGPLDGTLVVVLRLTCDPRSEGYWQERQARNREVNALRNVRTDAPDPSVRGRHRLLRISAQGRPRAHLLLDDPESAGVRSTTQRVAFEVPADQVDESGLLMVSVTGLLPGPGWADERLLFEPLVGVQGAFLRVRAGDGKPRVGVSTGRPGEKHWAPWSPELPYFALNRGTHSARLVVAPAEQPARRRFGLGRRDTWWPEAVEVAEADGSTRTVPVPQPDRSGTSRVPLPPGTGPALARWVGPGDEAPSAGLRVRVAAGTD